MIRKHSKKEESDDKESARHINHFRTNRYRVFLAPPYFNIDLRFEIRWNQEHLKQLRKHAKKPHLFHRQHTSGEITKERERHFKEHVLDSIPFHEKILKDHEKRLKTILSFMPKRHYKRISNISRKYGGTPEYFVYDKKNKDLFFVVEHLDDHKKHWVNLVKYKYDLFDVMVLG